MSVKKNLDAIVVEKLKESIINGEWFPGQILQIDDLTNEYGISRTPVILALKTMAVEGMLNFTSTGKIVVPKFSRQEIYDICMVRLLLEKYAIQTICGNRNIQIDELIRIADDCACALIQGDITKSRSLDMLFHKELVKYSGNTCLVSLYAKVQGQFAVSSYLIAPHGEDQQVLAIDEHFQLLQMLRDYEYEKAEKALTYHIEQAAQKIISRITD